MFTLDLQSKLYNILSTLNYNVYDYVPKNVLLPYIRIGTFYGGDDSSKLNIGSKIYQYIDIFSNYRGKKEIITMMQDVNRKLQNIEIKFDDLVAFIYLDNFKILEQQDKEGKYHHGILVYKILIKEKE